MGFFTETLRLVLDADMQGGVRNVEKFGETSEREANRSEKALDKWGNRLTSVGTGMIGFGAAALFGLGKAAAAAEEANLSVVKLENTIRNMPKLAGANSKEFTDLAESIQDVTAADADAIVEGQALLGTFSLTAKEIKGITPLVVDYARKFGTDIPDAAIQVGKALDGQVGALKRNGVSIDEALYKTDRYTAVQQALADQVGGFAEQEGKTFAGSLQRLKNQMGDLVEGVGTGAVEAFTDLMKVGKPVIGFFNDLDPAAQSVLGKFAAFGSLGLVAAGGTAVVAGQAMKLYDNLVTAAEGVSKLSGKLGGFKNLLIAGGIAAGVTAISVELAKLDDQASKARFEKLFGTFDTLVANLGRGGKAAEQQIEMVIGLGDKYGGLNDTVRRLADSNVHLAVKFIEAAEAAGIEGEKIDGMRQVLTDHRDAATAAAGGDAALTDAMADQAEKTEAAKTELEEYENQLNSLLDPLFGYIDALQSNLEANDAVTRAQDALNAAIAEHGPNSVEAANATAELEQAHIDASRSAQDMDLALQNLTTAVDTGEVSVSAATAKLQQWVDQGLITQQSADATAAKFFGLTGAIHTTPDGKVVHIEAVGAESTLRWLQAVKQAIDNVRDFEVNFSAGGGVTVRDFGGPVDAGTPYWVGVNRKPELFIPNSDGHIFTEQQLAQAGRSSGSGAVGSGGGGSSMVLEIRSGGSALDDLLVEVLRKAIKTRGGDVQAVLGRAA